MKNILLILCIFGGAAWWCYAIVDLMFFHTWWGLVGIWAGAGIFLIGWGEVNESEDYEIK